MLVIQYFFPSVRGTIGTGGNYDFNRDPFGHTPFGSFKRTTRGGSQKGRKRQREL